MPVASAGWSDALPFPCSTNRRPRMGSPRQNSQRTTTRQTGFYHSNSTGHFLSLGLHASTVNGPCRVLASVRDPRLRVHIMRFEDEKGRSLMRRHERVEVSNDLLLIAVPARTTPG